MGEGRFNQQAVDNTEDVQTRNPDLSSLTNFTSTENAIFSKVASAASATDSSNPAVAAMLGGFTISDHNDQPTPPQIEAPVPTSDTPKPECPVPADEKPQPGPEPNKPTDSSSNKATPTTTVPPEGPVQTTYPPIDPARTKSENTAPNR